MEYEIEIYQLEDNRLPFYIWLECLDIQDRQKIRIRLRRMSFGNLGDSKSLKDGLLELKIDYGPGYRIYYAKISLRKILILFAGTKRSQNKDIEKAKKYLLDFKMRGTQDGTK